MFGLCAPALIYIIFSLTQVIIDTFKGLYNTAFFKFIVMLFITLLLNMLCESGMSIISWLIVFIPFIFMSVIVTILLYVFGLDAATGTLNLKCDTQNTNKTKTGNLIYSNSNNQTNKYIDTSYSDTPEHPDNGSPIVPYGSSDPEYE
jgi:hypothetical protein